MCQSVNIKIQMKTGREGRQKVREWEKGREGATEGRVRSITMLWKLYV